MPFAVCGLAMKQSLSADIFRKAQIKYNAIVATHKAEIDTFKKGDI